MESLGLEAGRGVASLTGRVFSFYHILDRIGQGGMGTVYRALDRKANREVAIKFISPVIAQQEVFLNRFRREVKAVARLHHPHIVPVLDYGEQHGYAYLVMPLLEVGTLMDQLARGPVALELGARVMDQVASALTHAHRHGIVHRDVKPSNILLDRDHDAMLSDFGMAQFHDASVSLTGSGLIGTPAYMAPEQASGGPVDARCHQYALRVVLFYLVPPAPGAPPVHRTQSPEIPAQTRQRAVPFSPHPQSARAGVGGAGDLQGNRQEPRRSVRLGCRDEPCAAGRHRPRARPGHPRGPDRRAAACRGCRTG